MQIKAYYQQSKPSQIAVTNSKTECTDNTVIDKAERYPAIVTCVPPINNTDSTYYVWVNYSKAGMNEVNARGISLKSHSVHLLSSGAAVLILSVQFQHQQVFLLSL